MCFSVMASGEEALPQCIRGDPGSITIYKDLVAAKLIRAGELDDIPADESGRLVSRLMLVKLMQVLSLITESDKNLQLASEFLQQTQALGELQSMMQSMQLQQSQGDRWQLADGPDQAADAPAPRVIT